MAERDGTAPANAATGLSRVGEWAYERKWERYKRSARPAGSRRDLSDVATILGLPEGSMPAHALEAIAQLMDEVERLRWEHQAQEHQIGWLQDRVDTHSVLPTFNRRGFLAELTLLIDRLEDSHTNSVLLIFHIGGIERIRLIHGLEAGDQALAHAAAVIRSQLRLTDVLGCLGGNELAVVLTVTGVDAADDKAETVFALLNAPPFMLDNQPMQLSIGYGVAALRAGEDAETAMMRADGDRRARSFVKDFKE